MSPPEKSPPEKSASDKRGGETAPTGTAKAARRRKSRKAEAPETSARRRRKRGAAEEAPVAASEEPIGAASAAPAEAEAPDDSAPAAPTGPNWLRRRLAGLRARLSRAWAERRTPPLAPRRGSARAPAGAGFLCAAAAAVAIAAGLSGEALARAWTAEFGAAATLTALGPPEQAERDFDAALRVLSQTPGIEDIRVMPPQERRALLSPWLAPGQAAPADPPPMAALRLQDGGPDARLLRLRLGEQAPGAVYDDHAAWRGPLLSAADDARAIGWGAAALALAVGAGICALSAGIWCGAGRDDQRLLRRLGAARGDLVAAWPGRAAWRVLLGAGLGSAAAALALAAPELLDGPAARLPLAPAHWSWLALAAPAPVFALAAWLGARLALRPGLRGAPGI